MAECERTRRELKDGMILKKGDLLIRALLYGLSCMHILSGFQTVRIALWRASIAFKLKGYDQINQ